MVDPVFLGWVIGLGLVWAGILWLLGMILYAYPRWNTFPLFQKLFIGSLVSVFMLVMYLLIYFLTVKGIILMNLGGTWI